MSKKATISGLGILSALAIALWAVDAGAWPTYSASKVGGVPTGNCVTCHGDFQAVPYAQGGWAGDLMGLAGGDGHLSVIGSCNVCHGGGGFYPTSTLDSNGVDGQFGMSCLGCHGRFETLLGSTESSGLRQHHYNSGVTQCEGCHPLDSNPASYTPEGEDILPPYYDLNLSVVSLTDPCNPGGAGEDFAGGPEGLDNDGDLLYDEADPDCAVVPPEGCEFDWPVITIPTIAKGQSASQNAKVSHEVTGHIVGGAAAYGDTAHRIKICADTQVDIVITCSPEGCPEGGPFITKQVGGDFCTGAGCTVPLADKFKYVVTSGDGKDTDAVTLLPQ
ncbi:MAG: hypothetical protein JSU66_17230 [Deltaproteobacteria bacterium]|nr:MAG: hypothetical protein JSU66_17230 [Deltaproteobacteria bacterium]